MSDSTLINDLQDKYGSTSTPKEDCPICCDEYASTDMRQLRCCTNRMCKDCFARHSFLDLNEAKCYYCMSFIDPPTLYSDILDASQQLRVTKAHARRTVGWISCGVTGCSGGVPGHATKNVEVQCVICATTFCPTCCGAIGGFHTHPGNTCDAYQLSQGHVTVDVDLSIAWGGAVKCPYCGKAVQHGSGCDVLVCPDLTCGKQFRADGEKSLEHSSIVGNFETALKTLSEKSSLSQLGSVLSSHPKMVALFKLDDLIGRIEEASESDNAKLVQKYLGFLALNEDFAGLSACLAANFMPVSDLGKEFLSAIAGAKTISDLVDIVENTKYTGLYEHLVGDTAVLKKLKSTKPTMEGLYMLQLNKIKHKQLKAATHALLKKKSFE